MTQEILKELKKLVTGYSALSADFSGKNKLFDYITTAERIDIDYELKMTREFTTDSIARIAENIEKYGISAEEKISKVTEEINRILEII